MFPYQFVPSAMKEISSSLPAVAVMVGATLPGHFTPVNVAVNEPAPVLSSITKLLPAVAVGMVKVQLPVSVHVCTVPLVRASVCVVPLLPIATTLSV